MSKKLDSILQKAPAATVSSSPNLPIDSVKPEKAHTEWVATEKFVRVNAEVPLSVKRQIKQYIADHPGETEKTIILKGLKQLGFNIEDKYFYDLRGKS